MNQIIKISPKGQITLPKKVRDSLRANQLQLSQSGSCITLKPIRIQIIEDTELSMHQISEPSFDFWNNDKDDIYQTFYKA